MVLAYLLAAVAASHGAPAKTCAWRAGEILELSGEIESGGLTGRLARTVEARTGRLSETDELGIITARNGFDGKVAWTQDGSGGVHDLNSRFARELAISMAWLDGRQGCGPSRRDRMAPSGRKAEKGRSFQAWRATPAGGVPFELWYDARTGRLDRAFFQMSESRLIRYFADWRDIGGARFVAFDQRDNFPEDEDEIVRRISRASVHKAARGKEFARPNPPQDVSILNGASSTTIRYEDDHRTRIYIPVYLNGKGPFIFELDNGGHNILASETAAAIGLTGTGSFNSTGAGTSVSESGIARVARIQVGNAVITDQPVSIRKFNPASNDRSPEPPRAGILGLELFERFIVAIDRRGKTVTLKLFGSDAHPSGFSLPLLFAEDAPLIDGSYLGHRGDFMLDTGNAGPTIIEDYWARSLGLTAALEKGKPRGDTKVSLGMVGLGPIRLKNESISYYGPAQRGSEYSRSFAGVYGEPLLSRFNETYDYSIGRVWLDPLADVGPLPFDRSGLSLAKVEDGFFKVSSTVPGGPADQAGIRKGDVVSGIDGRASAKLSRADASAILKGKIGATIVISGTFNGVQSSKTIMLRELVGP